MRSPVAHRARDTVRLLEQATTESMAIEQPRPQSSRLQQQSYQLQVHNIDELKQRLLNNGAARTEHH